jgi:formate--tetrahydrofolate ligase
LVPVVALNRFGTDTDEEIRIVQEHCRGWGVDAVVCDAWALGGQGAEALAHAVMHRLQGPPPPPRFLYETDAPLLQKINTLATRFYGASEVLFSPKAADQLAYFEASLGRNLLVCMAKTQKSLSDNPELLGAPTDYTFRIQDVQISAGAGFVVPIAGEMMRMPGLPKVPAANQIRLDEQGQITGLF